MSLWTKFTAWLSGWPESTLQGKKSRKNELLFAEEEEKAKEPKLKVKKKKKSTKKSNKKGLKQGNMT